jgi:hypothetical protein
MKWLFYEEPGKGWRWELWDDLENEMVAYEEGLPCAAAAVEDAQRCGYSAPGQHS